MSDCVEWTGRRTATGYGRLVRGGKHLYAHRWTYQQEHGPIPAGMLVRHTCDNPPCVNPEHLVLGTQADNMRDMAERGRSYWRNRDSCSQGHLYTEENTYISKRGSRVCRTCRRGHQRRGLN